MLRNAFTLKSRLGVRLLALARFWVRSAPMQPQSSCTNQSGQDCSSAKRAWGSSGRGNCSPTAIARAALRSNPFTTGAREANRSFFASSTAVLTAADAGTRSIANSCCKPTCSNQRNRGGCRWAGTLPKRSIQPSKRRRIRIAP